MWSFLSVVAGALERRVWVDRTYYTLYPNLYTIIVGKSGMIKKSTTTGMAVDLLRDVKGIKFMSERLTAASLIDQMAVSKKEFSYRGRQHIESALFAYGSEMAVMLGEVFGSIIELLTTFYDCQPNDFRKPWIYKRKHEAEVKIHGPCLNILGASTKEWLVKSIGPKEMQGGFASRCVFVIENNLPDNLVAWPRLDKSVQEMRPKIVADLERISKMSGEFVTMPSYIKKFTQWYEHHMRDIVPSVKDTRFSGYLARKGDLIIKLSMIRAALLGDNLVLEPEHFSWALERVNEIEPDMMEAFGRKVKADDKSTHIAKMIYGYDVLCALQDRGDMSIEQLAKYFECQPASLKEPLSNLIGMGSIEQKKEGDKFLYGTPSLEESF